jgi:hypothetical protein
MNLAASFGIFLLTLAWLLPGAGGLSRQEAAASDSQSSPQAPASQPQSTEPAQPSSSPDKKGDKKVESTSPPEPSLHRHHHGKKLPGCTNSAAPLNPATDTPADPAAGSVTPDSAKASSAPLPPCPPPKKVIHNGGSDEPTIQLIGGTPAEQASNQRSTEQLTAATQENLNKIAQLQLTPGRQEMVNQIKQFMDQSKSAVAGGDAKRGHNLAQKAHLLSQELLKP